MAVVFPTSTAEPVTSASRPGLAPLYIELPHLACLLLCCLFFGGWVHAVAHLDFLGIVYFALLVITSYYLGRLVLRPLNMPDNLSRSFPMIFLVGILTWMLVMFVLHSLLPWSLPVFMLALFLGAVGGQFAIYAQQRPPCEEWREGLVGLFVVLFSLLAATCWGQELLHRREIEGDVAVYTHWRDYFDHASFMLVLLGDEHVWQFGSVEISGWRTPLYHYGSYLPSATLTTFSHLSTYEAVVALWTTLGTFLSGLAAFVVAAYLGRRMAGVWAAIALLILPDTSWYGPEIGYFSYNWLQQIGSAGLYGCCSSAVAMVFLWEARRSRSLGALLLAGAFTGGTFFLKAQIFVHLVPLLLSWFLLFYPRWFVMWRCLLLVLVALLGLGVLMIYNYYELGPRIGPDRKFFNDYCQFLAATSKPNSLSTLVSHGPEEMGWPWFYVAGTSLALVGGFGALLVALPVLTIWSWLVGKLQALDFTPWLALIINSVFVASLDDNFASYIHWELIHKACVWVYFLLTIWCFGKLVVLLNAARWVSWTFTCLVGLVLLAIPWELGHDVQRGRAEWCQGHTYLHVAREYLDCALYIREHSSRRDIVQDSQYDGLLVLVSQSERRAYLSRPGLMEDSKNKSTPLEVKRRLDLMESLKTMTTVDEIRDVVAETHIRWYVVHPDDKLSWPTDILMAPAFRSEEYAVYDFSKCIPPR